ncbi:MAG TPA: GNAT family N-acetyltransferase [Fimbriimonadaceae bacterium]|nr:GNAT family N-acetyltransferase [Fimbriimonadaceae bacterium]
MECHPLAPDIVQRVRANALATYLGLVEPVEGAVVSRPYGFTLVRGPGIFSFCNFAAGFDVAGEELEEVVGVLQQNASQCPNFYVFSMSGDSPPGLGQALAEGGFESRQSLQSMSWSGPAPDPDIVLTAPQGNEERLKAAQFMAQQFFWQMPEEAREAIAMATAASRHQILTVGPPSEPMAAVMLVQSEGTLGLFNLCVRPDLRGRGIGSRAVRGVQRQAVDAGSALVLHCGAHLVQWYRGLGFEGVGVVSTFVASAT